MSKPILLALLLLLALAGTASAERWTHTDTSVQAVTTLTLIVDWSQTLDIIQGGYETNPIMGPSGDRVHPSVYFPGVIMLQTLVARALPQPWRRISQVAVIGVELFTIGRNDVRGYNLSFDF